MVMDCHEYFVNDILVHNCIAWLLSYWFLTQSLNLEVYGINSSEILSECNTLKEENTPDKLYERYEQSRIRNTIDQLVDEIVRERDPIAQSKLERKLIFTASMLKLESDERFSIDEIIKNIKEHKRLNNIQNRHR